MDVPLSTDAPGSERRYLFVVGVLRSGTTVLYRLLNNHPQIALMFEADIFSVGPLLWPGPGGTGWMKRLDFWGGVLTRHGIEGDLARALPARVDGPVEAFKAIGQAYEQLKPGTYIGCKSIHYCNQLQTLARAFPTARFVVLWRPMGEIIDSMQRAGQTNPYLSPARRMRQVLQEYPHLVESVIALRRQGRAVHELVYRELVVNPEAACRSLCDFLDLPWAPQMLSIDPANIFPIPDGGHHYHARHTAPTLLRDRPLEIALPIAEKIRSYEDFWVARFANLPVTPVPRSALPPGPTLKYFSLVRWLDYLHYRVHRALIFCKLLVYRFAPLSWLHMYRVLTGRVGWRAGWNPGKA